MIRDCFGSRRGLLRLWQQELQWWASTRALDTESLVHTRRLVFVCRGNVCRSPLGEAVARARGFEALSFGLRTTAGTQANPGMLAAAAELGYDLSAHGSRPLDSYEPAEGDLLLGFELGQLAALRHRFPRVPSSVLGRWAWPPRAYIHDPYQGTPAYYHRCSRLIVSATGRLLAELGHSSLGAQA